jgi:hypothetical protein
MDKTIAELVRINEQNYINGNTQLSKYVDFSLEENINKIDAYLNSKHTSGETDSLGREKPFFNIVTAAVNIWYRATDIDRKDIMIKATNSRDVIGAFLASVHLQSWMRKSSFGKFLNEWGRTLARYGSSIVKFIEKDGKLHADVIPWNRLIVDPIDFDNDCVIEVLELTPGQLRKRKGYDQDIVDKLIDAATSRESIGKQKKDTRENFIKVYEVHGELPLSYLTGKEKDDDEYVQQMHVISFVAGKEKGKFDDYSLYSGKEAKHPYMITHLIKEDGRTQSIGAVEHLFESQWMMNHSVKAIKDQLDLASKLIFQTSDGNFVGQNAINSIETGDIMIHKPNEPLTQLANNSHDITSLQNFQQQWKVLGNEITGVSESMLGQNAPSGTAWRQTEALLQESHSLFEIMTENKGLDIEEMIRTYVIPHLKKKMDTTDEVAMELSAYNIDKINKMYVPNEAIRRANKKIAEQIFAGEIAQETDMLAEENGVRNELAGGVYFSPEDIKGKTWKDLFKDLEWNVEVEVTGEASDKLSMLTTLNTTLQVLAGMKGMPMSPDMKLVLNKILTATGQVSPMEMSQLETQPQTMQQSAMPNGGQGSVAEAMTPMIKQATQ